MVDDSPDRRRYPRIPVGASQQKILLRIVDYGPAQLFDMSYMGAALSQPEGKKLTRIGEIIVLHLKSDIDAGKLKAEVVRFNDQTLAVHFKDVGASVRVIIDRLVTDRIVGLSMNQMDPKDFDSQSDFSHWFHGPKETNLYLWEEKGSLCRAQMDMASVSLSYGKNAFIFENKDAFVLENKAGFQAGVVKLNNQQIVRKALAIIGEMDLNHPSVHEFHSLLSNHVNN